MALRKRIAKQQKKNYTSDGGPIRRLDLLFGPCLSPTARIRTGDCVLHLRANGGARRFVGPTVPLSCHRHTPFNRWQGDTQQSTFAWRKRLCMLSWFSYLINKSERFMRANVFCVSNQFRAHNLVINIGLNNFYFIISQK